MFYFNRVRAWGSGVTYLRVYPNPGFQFRWRQGPWFVCWSWHKGFRWRRI